MSNQAYYYAASEGTLFPTISLAFRLAIPASAELQSSRNLKTLSIALLQLSSPQ